ncbi:hypothetical protein LMG29542_07923 [Paraburkholderia humisilvae]|uniref:Uncharacterized protein n=1 Tax=Paraburkholderia humisilvae TaxID=627669 RepID=A0A6J5FBC9_9BURK|nr:hypothetical protein LMG29542_07923 [Paraburkholderia humisilvae]
MGCRFPPSTCPTSTGKYKEFDQQGRGFSSGIAGMTAVDRVVSFDHGKHNGGLYG